MKMRHFTMHKLFAYYESLYSVFSSKFIAYWDHTPAESCQEGKSPHWQRQHLAEFNTQPGLIIADLIASKPNTEPSQPYALEARRKTKGESKKCDRLQRIFCTLGYGLTQRSGKIVFMCQRLRCQFASGRSRPEVHYFRPQRTVHVEK